MFDGYGILAMMRTVKKLKQKCIAKMLTDIEEEFAWVDNMHHRVERLKQNAEMRGAYNTDELMLLFDQVQQQMPSYTIVRKIVLDSTNDFARNIFQAMLGDVEGYGSRR